MSAVAASAFCCVNDEVLLYITNTDMRTESMQYLKGQKVS